jgi:hypothetical protein
VKDDLLRPDGDLRGEFGRKGERLVEGVRMERLRSAEDGRKRLERHARHVVVRLLGGERDPGRLRVEAELPAFRPPGAVPVPHHLGPDPPRRPVLADLLEEVVVRVEEERQPGRELVHVEPGVDAVPDVLHPVPEREGQLLQCRCPGLSDVVARHGNGVPPRYVLRTESELVGDEAHGGARREDVLLLGDVLLQDVVLKGAADSRPRGALLFGHREVHRQRDRRCGVDRHGGRHRAQVDPVEEDLEVPERVDRHAALPHLAGRHRMVRVVP